MRQNRNLNIEIFFKKKNIDAISIKFKDICAHRRNDFTSFFGTGKFLNQTMQDIIKSIFNKSPSQTICMINIEAARQIEDSVLSPLQKATVIKEIFDVISQPKLFYEIMDFSFDSSVDYSLKSHKMAEKKYLKFNKDEYSKFMQNTNHINMMEYIILRNIHDQSLYKNNNLIMKLLIGDYESIVRTDNKKSQQFLPDNPIRNDTRRYFETKLAFLCLDSYASCNNLDYFFKSLFGFAPTTVNEIIGVVSTLTNFLEEDINHSGMSLKAISTIYKSKDRILKEGIPAKEHINKKIDTTIFSNNIGVMKSSQRIPADERSHIMLNRVVDSTKPLNLFCIDTFSKLYPGVAYTGSLSGHIYHILSSIIQYIRNNHIDKKHISVLFQLIVAVYVIRGYHSIIELFAVINEKSIQYIIKPYLGTNFDFDIFYFSIDQVQEALLLSYPVARMNISQRLIQNELHRKFKSLVK